MEGVAHRGIDAAVTSLRRAFYGLRGECVRLEWSHEMLQYHIQY